jgi:ankyrin repeat protein
MEVVKYLTEEGKVNPIGNNFSSPALFSAASEGMNEVLEYFINEIGIDVNSTFQESNWNCLHFACYWGRLKTVKLLISLGCNFNVKLRNGGFLPSQLAQQQQHPETVQYLSVLERKYFLHYLFYFFFCNFFGCFRLNVMKTSIRLCRIIGTSQSLGLKLKILIKLIITVKFHLKP